jgi:hypothetical protein
VVRGFPRVQRWWCALLFVTVTAFCILVRLRKGATQDNRSDGCKDWWNDTSYPKGYQLSVIYSCLQDLDNHGYMHVNSYKDSGYVLDKIHRVTHNLYPILLDIPLYPPQSQLTQVEILFQSSCNLSTGWALVKPFGTWSSEKLFWYQLIFVQPSL